MSCLDLTLQITETFYKLNLMHFEIVPLNLVITMLVTGDPWYDYWVEQIEKIEQDQLTWVTIPNQLYKEEYRISMVYE